MCLLMQLVVLLLVNDYTQNYPVFGQSQLHSQSSNGDLKRLQRFFDNLRKAHNHRSIPETKQATHAHFLRGLPGFISKLRNKDVEQPEIIKKVGAYEEIKPDCPELFNLTCDEQTTFLESIFGNFTEDVTPKSEVQDFTKIVFDGESVIDNESTTSTYDSNSTEDYDYFSLSERFHDPGLVASLLGGG